MEVYFPFTLIILDILFSLYLCFGFHATDAIVSQKLVHPLSLFSDAGMSLVMEVFILKSTLLH